MRSVLLKEKSPYKWAVCIYKKERKENGEENQLRNDPNRKGGEEIRVVTMQLERKGERPQK